MPLREAMTVGVRDDPSFRELGAIAEHKRRLPLDPIVMKVCQGGRADGFLPERVLDPGRQQRQVFKWCVAVLRSNPVLLLSDAVGDRVGDGKSAVGMVLFVVGVDQDRLIVCVSVQAVERESTDLIWSPAGVHQQFNCRPNSGAACGFQVG
jgi:hypothetical protein